MKLVLLAVSSIDGFITRGNEANIYEWTSPEDSKIFFKEIEKAKLIIMGAKTYGISRHFMKSKQGRKRVVITRDPQKYSREKISGFLEFTNESPTELVNRFTNEGIDEALIVGGCEINTLFLEENLISEIYLTLEPLIFGEGKKLFSEGVAQNLELLSSKKLNDKGTMLLKYKVLR